MNTFKKKKFISVLQTYRLQVLPQVLVDCVFIFELF